MGTDEEAISSVLRRYGELVGSGDFESWMSLWKADGRQMPPGAPSRSARHHFSPQNFDVTWEATGRTHRFSKCH